MKIAIPYKDTQVFSHFGKAEQFKIYEVNEDEILSTEVIAAGGTGHSALTQFLQELHINVVICGGIGVPAVLALREAGIQLMGGASGEADQQVLDFLNGKIHFESPGSGVSCSHHSGDGDEQESDGNIAACGSCNTCGM